MRAGDFPVAPSCRVHKKPVQNQSQRGETMTRRLVSGVVVGALAAAFTGSVAAQPVDPKGYVPGVAGCNTANCGYVLSATGTPENNVVKSATYNGARGLAGNLCYRTGYWAPSMAIE